MNTKLREDDSIDGCVASRVGGSVFYVIWGLAHVVHLWLLHRGALPTVPAWTTFLLAIALIRRPRSEWLPLALALSQLADVAWESPEVADHWALLAAANVVIVATYLRGFRGIRVAAEIAPVLRTMLIIAYAAAALSKWNSSFLDPVSSCAAFLGSVATFGVSSAIPGVPTAQVVVTLLVESTIPILLLVPRTRAFGARVGITFHFLVSLSPRVGVEDFTLALFAFFILFLPSAELDRALAAARRWISRSDIASDIARFPNRATLVFIAAGGVLGFADGQLSTSVLWACTLVLGSLVVVATWSSAAKRATPRSWGSAPAYLMIVPVLLLLYAASPYVGGRTTGVFTMFSNLRTEGAEIDNHLFLPSTDLFGYQDELVRVTGVNQVELEGLVTEELSLTTEQLHILVAEDPGLVFDGLLAGQQVRFGGQDAGEQAVTPNWFERHLLQFRPVQERGEQVCSV